MGPDCVTFFSLDIFIVVAAIVISAVSFPELFQKIFNADKFSLRSVFVGFG